MRGIEAFKEKLSILRDAHGEETLRGILPVGPVAGLGRLQGVFRRRS